MLRDGIHKAYLIKPVNGYLLHDGANDIEECDEESREPTGKMLFYYTEGSVTCGASYSFDLIKAYDENNIEYNAYGVQRKFFCKPIE